MAKRGGAPRVAIATSEEYPKLLADDLLFMPHLKRRGIDAVPAVWTRSDVDWKSFDAVVIRSTWDYFERIDQFRSWLRFLEARNVRVLNPVPVMLENTDKIYLKRFEELGVPTLPTLWLKKGDLRPARELLKDLAWDEVVVKPSVSAGAFRTLRTTAAELRENDEFLHELLAESHGLVQPFMREIVETGEWSFMFFGSAFSHAVLKAPKAGDFRVQWTHGGNHEKREAPAGVMEQVTKILGKLPPGRLYTRVDGVVSDGVFKLVEVELIEPYLFFEEDSEAPERFARALAEMLPARV